MGKLKDIWSKLKSIKHIEIYLALIVGLVVCVIYFSTFTNKSDTQEKVSTGNYTNGVEYVDYLENKLCNVLSNIEGVGDVSAIITIENDFSYEYATDKETSQEGETSVTTETTILVNGEPVIVNKIYPTIKGVVIVASGSEDFAVKMDILNAVQTLLEISAEDITILN